MTDSLKTAVIIAEDSDQQRSHFMDLTERMEDAIKGLQALEILLAGNSDNAISDLANLTAPFVKSLEEINAELMDFFYKSSVVFAYPVKQDQAEVNHED